jgi:hypothetical protein
VTGAWLGGRHPGGTAHTHPPTTAHLSFKSPVHGHARRVPAQPAQGGLGAVGHERGRAVPGHRGRAVTRRVGQAPVLGFDRAAHDALDLVRRQGWEGSGGGGGGGGWRGGWRRRHWCVCVDGWESGAGSDRCARGASGPCHARTGPVRPAPPRLEMMRAQQGPALAWRVKGEVASHAVVSREACLAARSFFFPVCALSTFSSA